MNAMNSDPKSVARAIRSRAVARNHAPEVRCAAYARQSVDRSSGSDFGSIQAQREAIVAHIGARRHEGWVPVDAVYDDAGWSGGTTERPGYQRLLRDAEDGLIDAIVVHRFDRLSRSLADFAALVRFCDERGIALVSTTQQIDTGTAAGRLLVQLLGSFAEFERSMIRERTRDKVRATRLKGLPCGGRPVLGIDIQGGRYVVNDAEAPAVRRIFATYLEVGTITRTLGALRASGIVNKRWRNRAGEVVGGAKFDSLGLRRLLTNLLLVGKVKAGDTVVAGSHGAIVDEATFRAVQEKLTEGGRLAAERRKPFSNWAALLSGLVACDRCGGRMGHTWSGRGTRRWRFYTCRKLQRHGASSCPGSRVSAPQLEEFVVSKLRGIGVERDLARRSLEIARERIRELQADRPSDLGLTPDDEALRAALLDFDGIWRHLETGERRRLVVLLVERVVVDAAGGSVEIRLRDSALQAAVAREATVAAANEGAT